MNEYTRRVCMISKKAIKFPIILILILLLVHSVVGSITWRMLLNIQALEIIFAGIFLTSIISYSYETLVTTLLMVKKSFRYKIDYEGSIYKVYNYAVKIKKHGILKLQNEIEREEHPFIKKSLELVSDMTAAKDIEGILAKDMESRKSDLAKAYNVLKMISQVAPAFGLIGTLIGMIGLLSNIDNSTALIGNMSSALISTLYGALISNFLAIPLMGRIREMIDYQILEYKIITEGTVHIAKNDSVRNVFNKMNAMLPIEKRLPYPQNYAQQDRGKIIYED